MNLPQLFTVLVLLVAGARANAFPELTTHGYVNCTACHVSPTGGGVLTQYGRGLSKELLSQSSFENEEKFLYGVVNPPAWLLPGGDVRVIQTYLNNSQLKMGQFFLMQADLALAIRLGKWTFAASAGIKGGPDQVKDRDDLTSRVHYAMYNVTDLTEVRVGKFLPQYGLNEPNHTVTTRQGLGFNEDMESYNAEVAYLGEGGDLFATAILGRPDDLTLNREKGAAISGSLNFRDKNKVGLSALQGESDLHKRNLAGAWGIFSLYPKVFLLSEADLQWETQKTTPANSTRGLASYNRLGYEPTQGVQVYAVHQLSYLDFTQVSSRLDAYGPGVDYFPRPHLEVRAEFLRERIMAAGPEYFDSAWILAHYYF